MSDRTVEHWSSGEIMSKLRDIEYDLGRFREWAKVYGTEREQYCMRLAAAYVEGARLEVEIQMNRRNP